MLRKLIFTLFTAQFLLLAHAQNAQDSLVIYMNEKYIKTEKENAVMQRTIIKNNNHYNINDKYISGKMIHYGEYSAINPSWIADGLSKHYDEKGILYSYGNYKDGKISGKWVYVNAARVDTINFENHITHVDYTIAESYTDTCETRSYTNCKKASETFNEEIRTYFLNNVQMPARMRKNRHFEMHIEGIVDTDGLIKCPKILNIQNNDFDLEALRVLLLYKSQNKINKALHFKTTIWFINKSPFLFQESIYFPRGNELKIPELCPTFLGEHIDNFKIYIHSKLLCPTGIDQEKLKGEITFSFIVNYRGEVVNLKIIKGISPEFDNEILKVIKSAPNWKAASFLGHATNVGLELTLNF